MASSSIAAFRARTATRWACALQGFALALVVAAPTLAVEEDWHGRPMIDQAGHLWIVPTLIVAAAFAAGGAVTTRRTVELWRALLQGLMVGAVVAGILLLADVVRRALHDQSVSAGVLRLWIEAAVLSTVIASLGGAIGYLRATRQR